MFFFKLGNSSFVVSTELIASALSFSNGDWRSCDGVATSLSKSQADSNFQIRHFGSWIMKCCFNIGNNKNLLLKKKCFWMRILEVNYCFLPEPARRPRTEWLWSQWPHLDNLTMAGRQAKVLNWQVGGLQVLLSYVKLKKRQVSVKQKLWKFHQFDKFDNLGAFLWKSATSGQRCIDSRLAISDLLQLDVQKITTEFWPSNKKIWKKSLLLCISMFCRLHFTDSIFLASLDFPEIAGVLFFFLPISLPFEDFGRVTPAGTLHPASSTPVSTMAAPRSSR